MTETKWTEVKITEKDDEGRTVSEFHWNAYDSLLVRLDNGSIYNSTDQGLTWKKVRKSWRRTITLQWKLRMWWIQSRWNRIYIRARYIFTGDCGMKCGIGAVEDPNGYWVDGVGGTYTSRFVPEDGCPVHDRRKI